MDSIAYLWSPLAGSALMVNSIVELAAGHGLVLCRLLGLLVTLPGCTARSLPWQLRGLLLLTLAAIITPNVAVTQSRRPHSQPGVQLASASAARFTDDAVRPVGQSAATESQMIGNAGQWLMEAGTELSIGLMLGLGAAAVVAAFRMGGEIIDQQTGWSVITTADDGESTSASGELSYWLAATLFFLMGGHLLAISTLLETFTLLPTSQGRLSADLPDVLGQLLSGSLALALQVSAPIIATQILTGIVLSRCTGSFPLLPQTQMGVLCRMGLAVVVLLISLSGFADLLLKTIPDNLQLSSQALVAARESQPVAAAPGSHGPRLKDRSQP